MLEDRVRALCEEGNWSQAKHAAETAVTKARSSLDDDANSVEELATSLEVKGDLLRQMGEHDDARDDYLEVLRLLDGHEGDMEQTGRVSASLAVLHDDLGEKEEARQYYLKAIEIFEGMDPPAELDVADLSNNLAFIYEGEDDFGEAETLFLKALKISHEHNGKEDPETAAICNNLGALYLKCGLLEQAREMHHMALEGREKGLGTDHVDTAQSHGNLAVTLAGLGMNAAAKEHFEKSVNILDRHAHEVPGDLAAVASNYTQFLRNSGDIKGAQHLDKRVAKKLKKH
ncbi:MAG: tetratricopeptide repeat protein [Akkermansiaceae bacterium]|nr:tetratricopeptide repeat protein [Akkermansiaceae bacterium]